MDVEIPRVAGSLDELVAGRDRPGAGAHGRRQVGRDVRAAADRRPARTSSRCSRPRPTGSCGSPATPRTGSGRSGEAGLYDEVPPEIDHTMVAMALDRTGPAPRLAMLMTDCARRPGAAGRRRTPGRAARPLHRAPGRHARREDRLDATRSGCSSWSAGSCSSRPRRSPPSSTVPDVPGPIAGRRRGMGPAARALARPRRRRPRRSTRIPRSSPTRCGRRRRPSWPATGSSATSAPGPTAARSCSTGPTPVRPRRAGSSRGTSPSTAAASPRPRRRPSSATGVALESRGVETGDWWDRQLGLCLLGMMATIAWEKAVGDEDELAWWTAAAVAGARWLG